MFQLVEILPFVDKIALEFIVRDSEFRFELFKFGFQGGDSIKGVAVVIEDVLTLT